MQILARLFTRLLDRHDLINIIAVLVAAFVLKCLCAINFLFLSDEAYLALWGRYVSVGFYDHPPMTGWIIYLARYLGESPLAMRLPTIIFTLAVGVGIYLLLKPYDRQKAYMAFLLFIFSPFNFAFFALMTDAPLFFFSFFSVFFLFKAETRHRYVYYLLSGAFLGLAFLSKYFAVVLYVSYVIYFLSVQKNRFRIGGLILLTLAAAPLAAQNILWNYHNGWPNIMHNFFNRLDGDTNFLLSILSLCLSFVYLVTPVVCYFIHVNAKRVRECIWNDAYKIIALAFLIPLCVFVVASLGKMVRPHWIFFILPFVFILAAMVFDTAQMVKCVKFSFVFSLLQTMAACSTPFLPVQQLKGYLNESDRASLAAHLKTQNVIEAVEPYKQEFVLATPSYAISALLEYHCGQRVVVFGGGSKHGRQDDIYTDFKALDGKDFAIVLKRCKGIDMYAQSFEKTELKKLDIGGATMYLLLGYNYNYPEYRRKYLAKILQKHYQIPAWLPYSESFFHKKYAFEPHTNISDEPPVYP